MNNKFDAFNKIMKIFDSCEDLDQLERCKYLLRNFKSMFKDQLLHRKLWEQYRNLSELFLLKSTG